MVGDRPDSTDSAGRPAGGTQKEAQETQLRGLLSRGEAAARGGQRGEARRLFREALELDRTNEQAWLWLAYLAPSPRQSLAYLQQVRAYHPRSARVRQATAWAQARLAEENASSPTVASPPRGRTDRSAARPQARPTLQAEQPARGTPERAMAHPQAEPPEPVEPEPPPPQPAPARAMARPLAEGERRRGLRPVVALALCVLSVAGVLVAYGLWSGRLSSQPVQAPPAGWSGAATPSLDMASLRQQANDAISRRDWAQVIPILENMRLLSPDDDGVRQQLALAHLHRGLQLVEGDNLDEAIAHYDAAIRFYANDMDLQTARWLAIGYRDGRRAADEQRWGEAVALLEPVYKVAPDYRDVAGLLYAVWLQQARELEAARNLEATRSAYARAAAIKPESEEARNKLAQIVAILTPPTPTPTPRPRKRIEVDVSEQRLRAYENDVLVFNWPCSTGIATMPTRYGDFQILDKIPEAWSSAWGLRMPYWMGIYWAGASENGIHALPILRNGTTLWAGYLGRPVSYGCIVLDTPNAASLYEWAEIGTPVKITP